MKQITAKKKGLSLAEAVPAVMIVAIIMVILVIAVYTFETLRGGFKDLATVTVNNETVSGVSETGKLVANYGACNFANMRGVTITNASGGDGIIINSANYTTTAAGLIQTVAPGAQTSGYNGTTTKFNVTYTYDWGGDACDTSNELITQTSNNIALAGLVLTVVLIALIIALLIGTYVIKGKGDVI